MRITIDTDFKTIELHGEVSINELNETLVKLLGDSVKEYKIIQSNQNNFTPITWINKPIEHNWQIHNPPKNQYSHPFYIPPIPDPPFKVTCES